MNKRINFVAYRAAIAKLYTASSLSQRLMLGIFNHVTVSLIKQINWSRTQTKQNALKLKNFYHKVIVIKIKILLEA